MKEKNIFYEKRISFKNNKFKIIRKRSNFFSKKFSKLRDGELIEISPLSNLYLNKIFNHLNAFGGGILIFDYGPSKKKKLTQFKQLEIKKKVISLNFLMNPILLIT